MPEVKVMITVDTDDVLDVLEWYGDLSDHTFDPENARWLRAYDDSTGYRKTEIWSLMKPSLQWSVHEFEQRGATALRDRIAEA